MKVYSFISHIKGVLLFAAVLFAITEVMNYLYVDDTSEFARCMMHEYYEGEENIDRLYLGSSHVFCDIDPVILDEINHENNFNLATSMQQLNTSYFLLKEADNKHHISRVYLDLAYVCTNKGAGNLHDYQWIPKSWTVMNQMRPSMNKLIYMLDLSSPEYYYMTFLPFMRYREKLFDGDYVAGIVKGKQTDEWKNYSYSYTDPDGVNFTKSGGKGYRIYYGTLEHGNFYADYKEKPIEEEPMTQESKEYLEKIVAYCREHDIKLTLITSPVSDFELVHKGGYDEYVSQVLELAKQYQVPHYDFNLCKREYLDLSQERYWSDMGHMNGYGAEAYSQFLGNFLQAQEREESTYADCFYNSFEEKISDLQDEIFGLQFVPSQEYERYMPDIAEEKWDEYVIYGLHPVTNAPENTIDLKAYVKADGETKELPVIREDNDGYVIFPAHEHGEMYVEAKLQGTLETVSWEQIKY